MGRIFVGFFLCLVLVPLAVLAWFRFGHPPVAVADTPFPMERQIVEIPLNARIAREMPGNPPIQSDENNLVAGAEIYRNKCAACHGFYGKPSSFAAHMVPGAPQLWQQHRNSNVVGVSDDPPGETYWKVSNGIRLTGMPSFKDTLSDTQIWQVTLLLAKADRPLPPAAVSIVHDELPAAAPAALAAPAGH
ncbi:MAG: cytochrome c [Terracidiphilus sp.]|jgi:mono/diheme cytochrome c family protein